MKYIEFDSIENREQYELVKTVERMYRAGDDDKDIAEDLEIPRTTVNWLLVKFIYNDDELKELDEIFEEYIRKGRSN